MQRIRMISFVALLAGCWSLDVAAQVSNDNEYGVNMVDEAHAAMEKFVPGELLVKFKEETPVAVKRVKGRYSSTSVSSVDGVLAKYGVHKFDKLLPAEEYKPQRARRQAVAPDGRMVTENSLDLLFHLQIASGNPDSVMMLVEELKGLEEVEYAEPNYYYYISGAPASMSAQALPASLRAEGDTGASSASGDVICTNPGQNPLYLQQWGIKALNIDQLWNKPIVSSKRPVIAILDTGVDINHPDLKDNIWNNPREAEGERGYDDDGNGFVDDLHGWDFVSDNNEMYDNNSHGTHVAGIAAASDNALGIIGANPKALIMPIKVMEADGTGSLATIIKGIDYAVKQGADVINMSLGADGMSISMAETLENAYITSVIVAAAGNNGRNIYNYLGLSYPAAYYCVIGVQATSRQEGTLASFSNYDPDGPIYTRRPWDGDMVLAKDPTVVMGINYETKAPGVGILSTVLDGKYAMYSGTSMATPLVAGAISALKMVKDSLNNEVLMTDLAHLDCDFAKIYENNPRPSDIYWAGMEIDDNIEGNSYPNGEIDAGETFYLYPVLLNGWGTCGKINMHLEVDEEQNPYVKIDNPDIEFGYSIGTLGHLKSKNPFFIHVSDQLSDDAKVKFLFTFHADGLEKTHEYYTSIRNMSIISGRIEKDTLLTADKRWYVPNSVSIAKGVTLTIEPGTKLELEKNAKILSSGKLCAHGTPERPIVFTGYKGAIWSGITSQKADGLHYVDGIYCNNDTTVFTLQRTSSTPVYLSKLSLHSGQKWYYAPGVQISERKTFDLPKYIYASGYYYDYSSNKALLTDPNFLTPIIKRLLADYGDNESICEKKYSKAWSEENNASFYSTINLQWYIYDSLKDVLTYCKLINAKFTGEESPIFYDCEFVSSKGTIYNLPLHRSNLIYSILQKGSSSRGFTHVNYIDNVIDNGQAELPRYGLLNHGNFFNNLSNPISGKKYSMCAFSVDEQAFDPAYLGTSREDLVRPYIWELGNAPSTISFINLNNMPVKPDSIAHGILWKIVVNGKDCQDEFEQLEPLGVGTHKVELYFSRPMNVAKNPQISYGLRKPYSTHELPEGKWSADSLIYTIDFTLNGREESDGLNRFFVRGAEDDEFFECPHDSVRFNIQIQSAGALATGFMAEAKLGRVELKWNNTHNDFTDAMGFNIYRYSVNDSTLVADTIRLNREILPIETTEYTDYEVCSGQTYHYFYRVLSTDLKEYDVSNTVAATPITALRGDANGSGTVDVADIITTVNYAANMQPRPFIFEAADMNTDERIDILDVVGIIQAIIHPEVQAASLTDATATYTVENGILYVESPVALAGVQVQLATDRRQEITVLESLTGFEHASAWLSDYDWLFLAYNMTGKTLPAGKTAILHIGNARIASVCLSDGMGRNVKAVGQDVTGVDRMGSDVMHIEGVYTLSGCKLSGRADTLDKLPGGVYIVNGKKVVK